MDEDILERSEGVGGRVQKVPNRGYSPRLNQEADALSKYAWQATPLQVHFIESIHRGTSLTCSNIDTTLDWAAPMHAYLEFVEFPKDEVNAKRIICLAPSYKLIDGTLYKKGFSKP